MSVLFFPAWSDPEQCRPVYDSDSRTFHFYLTEASGYWRYNFDVISRQPNCSQSYIVTRDRYEHWQHQIADRLDDTPDDGGVEFNTPPHLFRQFETLLLTNQEIPFVGETTQIYYGPPDPNTLLARCNGKDLRHLLCALQSTHGRVVLGRTKEFRCRFIDALRKLVLESAPEIIAFAGSAVFKDVTEGFMASAGEWREFPFLLDVCTALLAMPISCKTACPGGYRIVISRVD